MSRRKHRVKWMLSEKSRGVTEIAEVLNYEYSTVMNQLVILRDEGYAECTEDYKWRQKQQ